VNHRWIARGLVAALHLGLLAALWWHQPARLVEPRERQITTVRLIALPAPPQRLPALIEKVPPRSRERLTEAPQSSAVVEPPAAQPPPAPVTATPTTINPPTEPPRTTLRLTLPPGYAASSAAARNPALSDPRSNTPRPTLEDRIADATGGAGAWVEESTSENRSQSVGALGDRRTVMRRGDTCVEIFRSRIADTDPFNGNVAPRAVSMVGKPYKCK
jgi:hypothetical protein